MIWWVLCYDFYVCPLRLGNTGSFFRIQNGQVRARTLKWLPNRQRCNVNDVELVVLMRYMTDMFCIPLIHRKATSFSFSPLLAQASLYLLDIRSNGPVRIEKVNLKKLLHRLLIKSSIACTKTIPFFDSALMACIETVPFLPTRRRSQDPPRRKSRTTSTKSLFLSKFVAWNSITYPWKWKRENERKEKRKKNWKRKKEKGRKGGKELKGTLSNSFLTDGDSSRIPCFQWPLAPSSWEKRGESEEKKRKKKISGI